MIVIGGSKQDAMKNKAPQKDIRRNVTIGPVPLNCCFEVRCRCWLTYYNYNLGTDLLCIEHRKIVVYTFYNAQNLKLAHFSMLA